MSDDIGSVSLREATPEDDDVVTELMTAYLIWAHRVLQEDYGVDEPPTDAAHVSMSRQQMRLM